MSLVGPAGFRYDNRLSIRSGGEFSDDVTHIATGLLRSGVYVEERVRIGSTVIGVGAKVGISYELTPNINGDNVLGVSGGSKSSASNSKCRNNISRVSTVVDDFVANNNGVDWSPVASEEADQFRNVGCDIADCIETSYKLQAIRSGSLCNRSEIAANVVDTNLAETLTDQESKI